MSQVGGGHDGRSNWSPVVLRGQSLLSASAVASHATAERDWSRRTSKCVEVCVSTADTHLRSPPVCCLTDTEDRHLCQRRRGRGKIGSEGR